MLFTTSAVALLASVAAATSHFDSVYGPHARDANTFDYRGLRATIISQRKNLHQRQASGNQGSAVSSVVSDAAATTCLDPASIQTGSASTGQSGTIDPGQVESLTDTANFINFCKGQTLTNGLQVKTGSCNGIVMGKIPANTNMISSILLSPQPGEDLPALTTFNITVQMVGLAAGHFTNAKLTYYSAPQDLDNNGNIIGHTHVTVQDLGKSLTPSSPPDPKTFAFFKGINDVGDGNGRLSALVAGGLPAGNYRVCTMASSSNHQPVLMPVAQRGAQDDCTKFTVGGGVGGSAGNSTAAASSAVSGTPSVTSSAADSASSVVASSAVVSSAVASSAGASASSTVTIKSGSLGGAPPAVTASGNSARPFAINGDTFASAQEAVSRACSIQFNQCADAFNAGKFKTETIADCQAQEKGCTQG